MTTQHCRERWPLHSSPRSSLSHTPLPANQWGTRMTQAATTITQPPKPRAETCRGAQPSKGGTRLTDMELVRDSPPRWKHKQKEPLQEPHTPSGAEIQCHWHTLNDEIPGSNETIYHIICLMYVMLDEVAGVTLFDDNLIIRNVWMKEWIKIELL